MVFSSLLFVSVFLPAVLILYWILPGIRLQNALLLLASLLFYAYGEPVYVFLMIGSIVLNYLWAIFIDWAQTAGHAKEKGRTPEADRAQEPERPRHRMAARILLALAVIQNLAVLGVYKYAGFLAELWNSVFKVQLPVLQLSLPIGISFFTFQAMSYVIDVYRGDVRAQKNLFRVMLYISFFPQLIAGPIVNYHDIEQELVRRDCRIAETARGIRRFVVGLAKKVLIANTVAVIADTLFAAEASQISAPGAWLGAAAYMLQIYFDFSGYSDMALGLGWMFGFHFKENFCYPYCAASIREFWRRWHISLSGWFREYLYIPLGGNRKGRARTVWNKFLVFACTGIWHGANVTFLFWGLYHGFFQMLEEYLPFFGSGRTKEGAAKGGSVKQALGHVYVILVVLTGFVFFRADTMAQGLFWVRTMFTGFSFDDASMQLCLSLLTPVNLAALAAGIIGSLPWKEKLESYALPRRLSWLLTPALLVLCMMSLAGGTYNPFIYFRF